MRKITKDWIIGTIVWVIYGVMLIGLTILLDETLIYSGLFTYWTRTVTEGVIAIFALSMGYPCYISKIKEGYFIRKGLI